MRVPLTQEEANDFARAIVELHDRTADLERSTGNPANGGGRWELLMRDRVQKANAGAWGEAGIARGLERAREKADADRRTDWAADAERRRYETAFTAEARKLGGRIHANGVVDWPRDPGDQFGDARRRQADAAAHAALDVEKLTTNGGSGT